MYTEITDQNTISSMKLTNITYRSIHSFNQGTRINFKLFHILNLFKYILQIVCEFIYQSIWRHSIYASCFLRAPLNDKHSQTMTRKVSRFKRSPNTITRKYHILYTSIILNIIYNNIKENLMCERREQFRFYLFFSFTSFMLHPKSKTS